MRAATLATTMAVSTVAGAALLGMAIAGGGGLAERQTVEFIDGNGEPTGTAKLMETPNGVLIDAELANLEPGWHAFHVHERGRCDTPDFKSAGGHYHPHGNRHGFRTVDGPHAGDLPNIHVDEDGTARFQAFADGLTLKGEQAALLDEDGSALVVHAGADDYRSQPAGNAGSRIACAAVD